jgi:DNA-binding transcriptional LysR family regulator
MQWVDRIGRRLKLRDLHILMTVVQSGTMARAAQRLAVSQPVVSKAIADLEHTLGVVLLDRTRQGVEPTLYGDAVLKHGLAVFDELRQSVEEVEFLADPTGGELRIGCPGAMTAGFIPAVLKAMRRRHPRLTFDITQGTNSDFLYRTLRERNIDLVLGRLRMPFVHDDLSAEILFGERLVVVAGKRSKWVRRRNIELTELVNEPWIMPQESEAKAAVLEMFAACGLKLPRVEVFGGSLSLHHALIASGRLVATWPESVLRFGAEHLAVKALRVNLPVLPRPVGAVTLKGRTISPVAQLFIGYARKAAKSMAR